MTKLAYIRMFSYPRTMTTTRTAHDGDDLDLTLSEAGTGRPVLILHGGGGPATVAGLARRLSRTAHTITPVHPGWDGTPRPDRLTGIDDLAVAYLDHLRERGLDDVLVVGSSLGGWTAAEMAVRDTTGIITGLVLIDAVGVHIETEPITDVLALDARGLAEHSWHDPDRYFVDPAHLPADQLAARQANMATMRILAADPYMHNPSCSTAWAGSQCPPSCSGARATASSPRLRCGVRRRLRRRQLPGRPRRGPPPADRTARRHPRPDRRPPSSHRQDRRRPPVTAGGREVSCRPPAAGRASRSRRRAGGCSG